MKNLKEIIAGVVMLFLISSCSSKITFPVSTVTPAAEITATKKQDKQDNYKIKVTAKHLASAERLTPPKKTYVLWLMTQDGLRNIGQLQIKNDKQASLETVTPFNPTEVILTAEEAADISYPSGTEIARARFK